jgi:hypothetical protein
MGNAKFIIVWSDGTKTRVLKASTVSVYFRKYYNDIHSVLCVKPFIF